MGSGNKNYTGLGTCLGTTYEKEIHGHLGAIPVPGLFYMHKITHVNISKIC